MKYGGKETQVFFYREVLIQREALRHVPYALPYRTEVGPYIRIQYPGTSLVWQQQGGQDAEQGTFSGSVGTDEAEQFSLLYAEGYIAQGLYLSVAFAYMTDFDKVFHVTFGFQNLTFPYMPSLMCPSFSTAILTAYTWLARSSLVRMVLGVNSASSEIQTILPV